ncbi:hypothetical protein A3H22_04395 [Candidatus Peribacteria bacterium RIFCSPLOWO2_12_FULL_55_15]|nr:MAG: hypothetical protein A2789_01810 [Candidatus Peribacteria bacterium RIFCSPHIGHO2_01_FULL_54_22]OGJ62302.1 MAG: hypothetical protein A3D12_02070 [Candidatus Peribacteria bacterium RIFCSPHIGHO2_02_FULL_55_24]OGJ64665.1 MAG: hypothetical protein A3E47_00920 [Candidatus Peribacteria bacterium RIFCSPHIGHO2_12_FULL_54_10]OGJ67743.1 MAG: hypothetical protein A2947_03445 [Candidatus Peribacteria bacterium RIFCSPLOWO2_01_FULL_54_110]OGJ68883.1 MAG: hypothetical protein A3H90_01905 [Candidatus Pe
MAKKNGTKRGTGGITLSDVVVHMEHMEQRLSSRITGTEIEMKGMRIEMKGMRIEMKGMEERLTERIDAVEEDLTATMQDTMRIRAHVGMPVPTE